MSKRNFFSIAICATLAVIANCSMHSNLAWAAWVDADGSGTESINISDNGGRCIYPSLYLDNSGNPHIAWEEDTSGNTDIYYLKWNGSAWVDADGSGQESINISNDSEHSYYLSLSLDTSGNPHIAWYTYTSGKSNIYYLKWNGSAWVDADGSGQESINISNNSGYSGYLSVFSEPPSLYLDSSGNPHIAWRYDTSGNYYYDIYYLKWNGSAWVDADGSGQESINISNNSGRSEQPSLYLDTSGNPHIAWRDDTSGNYEVYYVRWLPSVQPANLQIESINVNSLNITTGINIVVVLKNNSETELNNLTVQFSYGDYEGEYVIGYSTGISLPANSHNACGICWNLPSRVIEAKKIYVKVVDSRLSSPVIKSETINIYCTDFEWKKDAYYFKNFDVTSEELENSLIHLFEPLSFDPYVVLGMKSVLHSFLTGIKHCFGMSATSILYKESPELKPVSKDTYKMLPTDNGVLAKICEYQWGSGAIKDALKSVIVQTSSKSSYDPNKEYEKILNSIKENHPVIIGLGKLGDTGGHAVVGYKIIDFPSKNKVEIYCYDSEYTGVSKDTVDTSDDDPDYSFNICKVRFDKTSSLFSYPESYDIAQYCDCLPVASDVLKKIVIDAYNGFLDFIARSGLTQIFLACPADALITDENGRKVGILKGLEVNDIPNATMNIINDMEVYYLPSDGKYSVQTTGTGNGTQDLSILISEGDGKISHIIYKDNLIQIGSKTYCFIGQGNTNYTMNIDVDGDGTIDQTKEPDYIIHKYSSPDMGDSLISKIHNYPNPLKNTGTTFTYFLAKDAQVKIKIYDIANDLVCSLDNLPGDGGLWNEYPWGGYDEDGKELSNGVYIYMIIAETGDEKETKINKLLILK